MSEHMKTAQAVASVAMILLGAACVVGFFLWLLRRARALAKIVATQRDLATRGVVARGRILMVDWDNNLLPVVVVDVTPPPQLGLREYRATFGHHESLTRPQDGWIDLKVDPLDPARIAVCVGCDASREASEEDGIWTPALLVAWFIVLFVPAIFLDQIQWSTGSFGGLSVYLGKLALWGITATVVSLLLRAAPFTPGRVRRLSPGMVGAVIFVTFPSIFWANTVNGLIPLGADRELDAEVTTLERKGRKSHRPRRVQVVGDPERTTTFDAERFWSVARVREGGPVRITVRRGILGFESIVDMQGR